MWHPDFLPNDDKTAQFLNFVEGRRISTLFLSVPMREFRGNTSAYGRFLESAHARGWKVQALNGDPEWVFPRHRSKALDFVETILSFNHSRPREERFDALHLDVEPQALEEWKRGRKQEIVVGYLALLDAIEERARKGGIPVSVDVAFGFNHTDADGSSLTSKVVDIADEIVVMAYRSRAEQILRSAAPAIEAADARGKKAWVGISAKPEHLIGEGLGSASASYLEGLVSDVESAFQGHPSFLGVAIHDYRQYQSLVLTSAR